MRQNVYQVAPYDHWRGRCGKYTGVDDCEQNGTSRNIGHWVTTRPVQPVSRHATSTTFMRKRLCSSVDDFPLVFINDNKTTYMGNILEVMTSMTKRQHL